MTKTRGPQPDFASWSQENLAKLATELWDENLLLRADNKLLLVRWRVAIKELGKTPT